MGQRDEKVDAYLAASEHPRKEEIQQLRAAILAADPGITESVKWNAPNFRFNGVDRVTFRLQPGNRLQLIFHRGVGVRDDTGGFRFDDPSGMLEWVAPDRGVLTLADADDTTARSAAIADLVQRWVRA